MLKKILVRSCVSTLALGVVVTATPAYAGFEWVRPSSADSVYVPPATTLPAPPPLAHSGATGMPDIISPVIISGDTAPSSPSSPPATLSSAPVPLLPPVSPASAAAPASPSVAPLGGASAGRNRVDLATATIGVPPSVGDDVVRGFASQVPLTLALRQILPAAYSFSLDQDVDMDTQVSYKGGKPWRETLGDVLGSVGLTSHDQGNVVTVSRASTAGVVMPPQVTKAAVESSALVPLSSAPAISAAPVLSKDVMPEMPLVDVGAGSGAGSWTAQRGDTLRKVLSAWCQRAGVELQWLAEYDYPVEASAHFNGGFEDALRGLLAGFEGAHPQPTAELHADSAAGQGVLVVQTRGNSSN
jgi:hypothetical protein